MRHRPIIVTCLDISLSICSHNNLAIHSKHPHIVFHTSIMSVSMSHAMIECHTCVNDVNTCVNDVNTC